MTDREALAAALEMELWFNGVPGPAWWDARLSERTAARERLAQLPEKCGTCRGTGFDLNRHASSGTAYNCPTCHGSGKVYPAELVERIAEALRQVTLGNINASLTESRYPLIAVAVLAALDGETP